MISDFAKRLAAHLPQPSQQELKRRHFRREIERGTFRTDEPEWALAAQWLRPGDWAIDVGANIGHYAKRFSDLVGAEGRVIAFEPVPATFELLTSNVARFEHANVTLLNLAASDGCRPVSMNVPRFETGLRNYYQAAITPQGGDVAALTCAIDSLQLPAGRVRLIKIDAEGHDAVALRGGRALLERDRPVIVIESASGEVLELMRSLGYANEQRKGSSNIVFDPGVRPC
jgi:FkbM family methyltransferase